MGDRVSILSLSLIIGSSPLGINSPLLDGIQPHLGMSGQQTSLCSPSSSSLISLSSGAPLCVASKPTLICYVSEAVMLTTKHLDKSSTYNWSSCTVGTSLSELSRLRTQSRAWISLAPTTGAVVQIVEPLLVNSLY